MAKLRKSFLKTIMVFVVFFTAIAPVYAAGNTSLIPFFKDNSSEIQAPHSAMPCHKNMVKSTINKKASKNKVRANRQISCFKHCLSYLNEPWLATNTSQLTDELIKQNNSVIEVSFNNSITSVKKGAILSRAPPIASEFHHSNLLNLPNKGLSKLLLMTARLRD